MSTVILCLVGILLLGMGCFIGVKQRIELVHSYHYENVSEQDRPSFCKRVGLGNAVIGGAILAVPVLRPLLGETIAIAISGATAVIAGAAVVRAILKYNRSLF